MRQLSTNAGEQAEFYNCVARLALLQTSRKGEQAPLYYKACGETREYDGRPLTCNKRVGEDGVCPSCNKISTKTNLRLNIRGRFGDYTDSAWLTTFHEAAEQVLGMKAEEVQAIESGDGGRDKFEELIAKKYFLDPIQLTVRAKLETYNGDPRVNTACTEARAVNRRDHGRALLKEIQQMVVA